ncbi:MAG: hypothetical protein IJ088_13640, partial [Clostridia bacterium]|nr:hypothetical protein [Clostridia bacterium]
MSGGLFLRNFCGFALQFVPCAMLLIVPFYPSGKSFSADIKKAFTVLTTVSLAFSLCYPLSVWWNAKLPDSNLDDNLFMLLAIVAVTALFMRIVRESFIRKFTVLFAVITYADIQFFLSNMLMEV